MEVQLHPLFDLGAGWWWVVSVRLRPLYRRERDPVPVLQGLGGPRTGLDGCGKSDPDRDSIAGPSSP